MAEFGKLLLTFGIYLIAKTSILMRNFATEDALEADELLPKINIHSSCAFSYKDERQHNKIIFLQTVLH